MRPVLAGHKMNAAPGAPPPDRRSPCGHLPRDGAAAFDSPKADWLANAGRRLRRFCRIRQYLAPGGGAAVGSAHIGAHPESVCLGLVRTPPGHPFPRWASFGRDCTAFPLGRPAPRGYSAAFSLRSDIRLINAPSRRSLSVRGHVRLVPPTTSCRGRHGNPAAWRGGPWSRFRARLDHIWTGYNNQL